MPYPCSHFYVDINVKVDMDRASNPSEDTPETLDANLWLDFECCLTDYTEF